VTLTAAPERFRQFVQHANPAKADEMIRGLAEYLEAGSPEAKAWIAENLAAKATVAEKMTIDGVALPLKERMEAAASFHSAKYWCGANRGDPALVHLADVDHNKKLRGELVESAEFPGMFAVTFHAIKLSKWGGELEAAQVIFKKPATGNPLPWHTREVFRANDRELIEAYMVETAGQSARDAAEQVRKQAEAEAKREQDRAEYALRQAERAAILQAKAEAAGVTVDELERGIKAIEHLKKAHRPRHCKICGRSLTVRQSASEDIGPECKKIYGVLPVIRAAKAAWAAEVPRFTFSRKALEAIIATQAEGQPGATHIVRPPVTTIEKLIEKLLADGHTIGPA